MSSEINTERRPSKVLKFAPVKLLVIESRGEYLRTVIFGLSVGLSHIFIGATTMITILYTMKTGDVHASLCTIGYQLFSAEAILALSYVNGWSAHLRLKHRVIAHIVLQICGISCAMAGLVPLISSDGLSTSFHGSSGHITLLLTLLTIITSSLATDKYRDYKFIHVGMGVVTFSSSSICLCFGLYTKQFELWVGSNLTYILTTFVILYTISIFSVTLVHGVFNKK